MYGDMAKTQATHICKTEGEVNILIEFKSNPKTLEIDQQLFISMENLIISIIAYIIRNTHNLYQEALLNQDMNFQQVNERGVKMAQE